MEGNTLIKEAKLCFNYALKLASMTVKITEQIKAFKYKTLTSGLFTGRQAVKAEAVKSHS